MALMLRTLLDHRVLISRGSARSLQQNIVSAFRRGRGSVKFDLSDIDGIAPSFFDEILTMLDECSETYRWPPSVLLVNPPTALSTKFEAVARAHQLVIDQSDGAWVIAAGGETSAAARLTAKDAADDS